MDCDDVTFLLARGTPPSDAEAMALDDHVAGCEACAGLVAPPRSSEPFAARLPAAPGRPSSLTLPTVDPAWFEVGEAIAAGGMGKVTRAFDRRLGREVAIKEMLTPALSARF